MHFSTHNEFLKVIFRLCVEHNYKAYYKSTTLIENGRNFLVAKLYHSSQHRYVRLSLAIKIQAQFIFPFLIHCVDVPKSMADACKRFCSYSVSAPVNPNKLKTSGEKNPTIIMSLSINIVLLDPVEIQLFTKTRSKSVVDPVGNLIVSIEI